MKLTNENDWVKKRAEAPYKTATELLADPKMNLTARGRRRLTKARQLRYQSTQKPKYGLDRLDEKISRMGMVTLTRTIAKCKARVSKADRILEDLAPDSLMRPAVEAQRTAEQNALVMATNEYKLRTTKPPIKDARNPQHKRIAALVSAVKEAIHV